MSNPRRDSLRLVAGTTAAAGVRDAVRKRGLALEVGSQWNWGLGSFEGIWIGPATGWRVATGDARRCSMAEAV